jgi:hypothetical protein
MENDRRINEEQQRKDRFDQIQTEVHDSYAKNIGIEFKWQALEQVDDCEELSKEIEEQKSKCQAVIDKKDKLI